MGQLEDLRADVDQLKSDHSRIAGEWHKTAETLAQHNRILRSKDTGLEAGILRLQTELKESRETESASDALIKILRANVEKAKLEAKNWKSVANDAFLERDKVKAENSALIARRFELVSAVRFARANSGGDVYEEMCKTLADDGKDAVLFIDSRDDATALHVLRVKDHEAKVVTTAEFLDRLMKGYV